MKLIELELKNYTRLYVSGIKHIIYRPRKSFNIILGRNGSGKSSLIKEIFPNVEDLKNDYDKGGYKKLILDHNNNRYVITYDRDTDEHSFICNGEELNQQNIKKTQKILIEEHFKLNKIIYEMLLSSSSFCSMSVSERKKWFTNILTTIDYDYALNLYNKTKVRIKELASYMKLTQTKLIRNDEILKELNPGKIESMKKEKDLLYKMLDNLLNQKSNVKPMKELNLEIVADITLELNKLLDSVSYGLNIEKLNNDKIEKTTLVNHLKNEIPTIDKNLSKIDELNLDQTVSLKDLEEEKSLLDKRIESYRNRYNVNDLKELKILINNFKNNYETLLSLSENIIDLLEVKDIDNETISKTIDILSNKLSNVLVKSNKLKNDYIKYSALEKQEDVTCPKCSNIFKPNFDNALYSKVKNDLDIISKEETSIVKELEELKDKFNRKVKLDNLVNELKRLLDSCCFNLKAGIIKETKDLTYLDNLINIFSNINVSISSIDNIESLIEKEEEIKSKLNIYKKLNNDKIKLIEEKKNELLNKRLDNLNKINSLTKEVSDINKTMKHIEKINELKTKLSKAVRYNKKYADNKALLEYDNYINNSVIEIKREINEIESTLLEYDRVIKYNKDLESELKDYEERLKVAKNLEVMLSPNKGLIGESINATINHVLSRMNTIINKVWTYPIEILPCNIEENDLTFRFPVKINNVKDIPDVSKGSSAIKDIIDLSFKVTAMEFLELLDYPLIIDELGATFSPDHRIRVYDFIDELSKGYYEQVFMISHFESMYNRFSNADVIVLDNETVNYTGNYNEVVKIM